VVDEQQQPTAATAGVTKAAPKKNSKPFACLLLASRQLLFFLLVFLLMWPAFASVVARPSIIFFLQIFHKRNEKSASGMLALFLLSPLFSSLHSFICLSHSLLAPPAPFLALFVISLFFNLV
jgi:hypothetical protein